MAAPAARRLRRMAGYSGAGHLAVTARRRRAAGRPGTSRATNRGEAGDPPASPRCWPPRVWRVTGEGFPLLTVMTACGGHLAVWPRVSSFRRGRGSPRRLPTPRSGVRGLPLPVMGRPEGLAGSAPALAVFPGRGCGDVLHGRAMQVQVDLGGGRPRAGMLGAAERPAPRGAGDWARAAVRPPAAPPPCDAGTGPKRPAPAAAP
jgi:hypothetical protein